LASGQQLPRYAPTLAFKPRKTLDISSFVPRFPRVRIHSSAPEFLVSIATSSRKGPAEIRFLMRQKTYGALGIRLTSELRMDGAFCREANRCLPQPARSYRAASLCYFGATFPETRSNRGQCRQCLPRNLGLARISLARLLPLALQYPRLGSCCRQSPDQNLLPLCRLCLLLSLRSDFRPWLILCRCVCQPRTEGPHLSTTV
jgi:hypothetical protein